MSDTTNTPALTPSDSPAVAAKPRRRARVVAALVVAALVTGGVVTTIQLLTPRAASDPAAAAETPTPQPTTPAPTVGRTQDPQPETPATASPTPTPGATAEFAPLVPDRPARLTLFELTGQVECDQNEPPEKLQMKWTSTDAVVAYIGIDTTNASISGSLGFDLPPNGTDADFPGGSFIYPCGADQMTYTLTVVGADGSVSSEREVVINHGFVY